MNYKGWWLSGKLHDQGEFFCNGNTYTGDFVGGLRQGNGQLKYSNGALYVGEFAKDLPNGEGTLTSSSNEIYTGNFKVGFYFFDLNFLILFLFYHREFSLL